MGADVRLVDEGFDIGIRKSWADALEDVKAKAASRMPFRPVPRCTNSAASVMSASRRATSTGKGARFAFDYVVVCTVTGSTHAGMVVGFAKDGRARRVIGIDASATPAQTKAQVLKIAQDTARLVELDTILSRRTSSCWKIMPIRLRRSVGGDQGGDAVVRAARGHDHGSCL
jgi:1-aminocyclopropane-1-carboxylate deaminase